MSEQPPAGEPTQPVARAVEQNPSEQSAAGAAAPAAEAATAPPPPPGPPPGAFGPPAYAVPPQPWVGPPRQLWLNPARRVPAIIAAVIAALVLFGGGMLAGAAVSGGHDHRGPMVRMIPGPRYGNGGQFIPPGHRQPKGPVPFPTPSAATSS